MRYGRFSHNGRMFHGIVEADTVRELSGSFLSDFTRTDVFHALDDLTVLTPTEPGKIIGVGLNYRSHAEELGMPLPDDPLVFLKPPSAALRHRGDILCPAMAGRVDYEGELAVVIGRKACRIQPEDVPGILLGATCFNDVTARDLQKKDVQFTRSKSFDTFAPFGPWIETDINPDDVTVRSMLNGRQRQSGRTSDFIFPVNVLVSFVSHVMTLLPGDVITTGTPSGIGPMKPGDYVEVTVEGVGTLYNDVR